MIVPRPDLNWHERLYLPAIFAGMIITIRHLMVTFLTHIGIRMRPRLHPSLEMTRKGDVTMQYPEETWKYPEGHRGAPALVTDEEGREKCVSCQMCEFVCPPRAIRIEPGEITPGLYNKVEKAPKAFEIDMLRCIYCGQCEEACPEEAIFLQRNRAIMTGLNRQEMVNDKEQLYKMGGVKPRPIRKWKDK